MSAPMLSVAKKELKAYFGSPMAAIFIGAFLLASLFSFFWVETFFARNIADIRPLFRWMPLLMIFLVASLTMRQWSEEQKMGTLEVLLTLPVRLSQLVLGKFLAVLALVGVALLLTAGLPLTVSLIGNLDWGPVIGGYLGALLVAAAYIAIGLFVSSRTDNQIIALIVTVLVAGFFYLLGSSQITAFLGNDAGEVLRALGTGSRFASIERGVIDLRDVVYYLSLAGVFLVLNVVSLDRKRWSAGRRTERYRRNMLLLPLLVAANLLAANLWLDQVHTLRADLTENHEYSISQTTRDLIANLDEPLVMRGYFSEKTHPLLAPLVPRIRDMMEEYRIASGGRINVSFVDPRYDQELEAEANQQYGIKPVPFQVAGRYEASVVNSYFDILIKYGDQYVTLGYDDLVEVHPRQDGQLEVSLRNLEYDLTKSIKKVVYGFQSLGAIFAGIDEPMALVAVVTPQTLPGSLAAMPGQIREAAEAVRQEAATDKLSFRLVDPDAANGPGREAVNREYGIEPLSSSLFTTDTFYLHLFLEHGGQRQQIYLTGDMGKAEIRREIEAAIKRTSSGFMKTVGVWTPQNLTPQMAMLQQAPADDYQFLQRVLRESYNVRKVELADAAVPGDIDVLLLVAPQGLGARERFAVDQYLMRGGAVVALAGNYVLDLPPGAQRLAVRQVDEGLGALLEHYGITVRPALVMDRQNEPFPVPVSRDLGGFVVQEVRQLDYPFFVDVRGDGMNRQSPLVSSLQALTLNYVSPVEVDRQAMAGRTVTTLLKSSPEAWLAESDTIQPDFERYPESGFAEGEEMQRWPLAVSVQGVFPSYFAGKEDPRLIRQEEALGDGQEDAAATGDQKEQEMPLAPVIERSAGSARLVVVGSSEFVNDSVIAISRSVGQDRFLSGIEFVQNTIDWAVEDDDLLAIRSRGSHARLLAPLSLREQAFWEWLNYGLALAALVAVSLYAGRRRRHERPMELEPVES